MCVLTGNATDIGARHGVRFVFETRIGGHRGARRFGWLAPPDHGARGVAAATGLARVGLAISVAFATAEGGLVAPAEGCGVALVRGTGEPFRVFAPGTGVVDNVGVAVTTRRAARITALAGARWATLGVVPIFGAALPIPALAKRASMLATLFKAPSGINAITVGSRARVGNAATWETGSFKTVRPFAAGVMTSLIAVTASLVSAKPTGTDWAKPSQPTSAPATAAMVKNIRAP